MRTAQLWERDKALPVRRIPGGQKSRVFARTEDLDRWRAGMPALTRRRALLFATAGAVFLALVAGSVWASRRPGEPAASHLQNNTLI